MYSEIEDDFITFECNGRGSGLCFNISVDCNYNSGLNLVFTKYIPTCNRNPSQIKLNKKKTDKKQHSCEKRCTQCSRSNKYEDDKKILECGHMGSAHS